MITKRARERVRGQEKAKQSKQEKKKKEKKKKSKQVSKSADAKGVYAPPLILVRNSLFFIETVGRRGLQSNSEPKGTAADHGMAKSEPSCERKLKQVSQSPLEPARRIR